MNTPFQLLLGLDSKLIILLNLTIETIHINVCIAHIPANSKEYLTCCRGLQLNKLINLTTLIN